MWYKHYIVNITIAQQKCELLPFKFIPVNLDCAMEPFSKQYWHLSVFSQVIISNIHSLGSVAVFVPSSHPSKSLIASYIILKIRPCRTILLIYIQSVGNFSKLHPIHRSCISHRKSNSHFQNCINPHLIIEDLCLIKT